LEAFLIAPAINRWVLFGVIESIEPKGSLGLYKNEEFYGY
jgi:hypothetical protein